MNVLLPIIFGIGFGYILYKVGALEYQSIVNALRLKDLTIPKFMLFSVAVSVVGVFSLRSLGLISLSLITTNPWADIVGGLIFGVGFAFAGYCPGTSIGAWGEGKRDAGYAIVGGLVGILVYTLLQQNGILSFRTQDLGMISLIDLISLNPLTIAVIFSTLIIGMIYLLDYWEENRKGGI